MTLTMIMAIIAAMLFGVFCALCLYSIFRNQKDVEKSENRMRNIEKKLGNMTELINSRTDMLESKINEQPIYNVYSDMIDVNPSYPYDVPAEGTEGSISISDLVSDDFEDVLVDSAGGEVSDSSVKEDRVLSEFMSSFKSFEKEFVGDSTGDAAVIERKPVNTEPVETEARAPIETAIRGPEPMHAAAIEAEPRVNEIQAEKPVMRINEMPVEKPAPEMHEIPVSTEMAYEALETVEPRFAEQAARSEDESAAKLAAKLAEALEAAPAVRIDGKPIAQGTDPLRHHEGHDVGKSGKKYTASELEKLIRE